MSISRFLATFVAALHLVVSTGGMALHVGLEGGCCDHSTAGDRSDAPVATADARGCHCHASDCDRTDLQQRENSHEAPIEPSEHDCSDCVLCQTLAQPGASADVSPVTVLSHAVALEPVGEPALVFVDVWAPESRRGPPVC